MQNPLTEDEQDAAARFLVASGIAAGTRLDAMTMLGYLISIIKFALFDFPKYHPFRLAVARFEAFERAAYAAAAGSVPGACSPRCADQDDDRPHLFDCPARPAGQTDPAGFLYSRPADPDLAPVAPPDGVDGVQLGTRAFPPRPVFLDGPALPVCMVDPTTLFCRTHQGIHVTEESTIFDVLTGGL